MSEKLLLLREGGKSIFKKKKKKVGEQWLQPLPQMQSQCCNFWGNWFILGADIFVSRCSCTDSPTLCIVRGFQRERLCPEQGLIRASCLPFICFPIKYENRPQSAASIFLGKAMGGIIIWARLWVFFFVLFPAPTPLFPNFPRLALECSWETRRAQSCREWDFCSFGGFHVQYLLFNITNIIHYLY